MSQITEPRQGTIKNTLELIQSHEDRCRDKLRSSDASLDVVQHLRSYAALSIGGLRASEIEKIITIKLVTDSTCYFIVDNNEALSYYRDASNPIFKDIDPKDIDALLTRIVSVSSVKEQLTQDNITVLAHSSIFQWQPMSLYNAIKVFAPKTNALVILQ